MKRCPRCGFTINIAVKVCTNCGYQFPQSHSVQYVKGKSGSSPSASQPKPSLTGRSYSKKQPSQSPTSIGSKSLNPTVTQPGASLGRSPKSLSSGGKSKKYSGRMNITRSSGHPSVSSGIGTSVVSKSGNLKKMRVAALDRLKHIFTPITKLPPQLQGIVDRIDPPSNEPIAFNWAKTLVLLPLLPFLLSLVIMVEIFQSLCKVKLSGLTKPLSDTFFRSIGIGSGNMNEPVQVFCVRDNVGNQYQVKIQGHTFGGSFTQGDPITIWGRWDKLGILNLEAALVHRTGVYIHLRNGKAKWQKILVVLVFISVFWLILALLGTLLG